MSQNLLSLLLCPQWAYDHDTRAGGHCDSNLNHVYLLTPKNNTVAPRRFLSLELNDISFCSHCDPPPPSHADHFILK